MAVRNLLCFNSSLCLKSRHVLVSWCRFGGKSTFEHPSSGYEMLAGFEMTVTTSRALWNVFDCNFSCPILEASIACALSDLCCSLYTLKPELKVEVSGVSQMPSSGLPVRVEFTCILGCIII